MARCATIPACFARIAPILLFAQLCERFVQLCVHLITCFFCFGYGLDPVSSRNRKPMHRSQSIGTLFGIASP